MAEGRTAKRRDRNEVEFARIVAFSDGVFAIAITLLVLNLSVPADIPGDDLTSVLWDQRFDLLAYALSFAVIGRFWVVHHRVFGDLTGFDGRLIGLNLFYLAWIVLIPFSSQVLGEHAGDTGAVVVYAVNLAAVTLIGDVMFADARRAGLLRTNPDRYDEGRRRGLITAAIFLASVPIAFVNAHIAPYLWLGLFLEPVRRRARLKR
ncbi:MAG TPA: TMEM175 family protein [Solirubrobacterales bacterium]|nr:TMEM175 family protein [Solirubrobacterales bacterium]